MDLEKIKVGNIVTNKDDGIRYEIIKILLDPNYPETLYVLKRISDQVLSQIFETNFKNNFI